MHSFGSDCLNLEKITDESALKDIFLNDSSITVKIKAQELIEDKDFLYDECLNNPSAHLRFACLNHIIDDDLGSEDEKKSLLSHLTLNDPDDNVRLLACKNLDDASQDVFCHVLESGCGGDLRRQVISKIRDVNILNELALNSEDKFIRLEAIQNPNMDNLDTLSQIILGDSDEFNRYCACGKIPDEYSFLKMIFKPSMHSRLPELAKNTYFKFNSYFLGVYDNLDEYEKIVALNFITDESFLEDIVLNETDDKLRCEAVANANFKNQAILINLIKNCNDLDILFEAVSKVDDEDVLIDYVKNNLKANKTVLKAISKITNHEFLKDLSACDFPEIRLQAVKRMSNLNDSNYLFDSILHDIALSEPAGDVRISAIMAISKTNDLIDLADNLSDKDSRLQALKNIKKERLINNYILSNRKLAIGGSLDGIAFKSTLNSIALTDSDEDIRKEATSKLSQKNILDEIAVDDVSEEVRRAALKRLESLWNDIKRISDENVLEEIYRNGDRDVKNAVKNQINDLRTWKDRIREISDIDDIETLKDMALNDYN